MRPIIAALRRIPAPIVEHGCYTVALSLTPSTFFALVAIDAVRDRISFLSPVLSPTLDVAFAFHYLPELFDLFPLVPDWVGSLRLSEPVNLAVYFAIMVPPYFILWLTVPAATAWWLFLRQGKAPYSPDRYGSGKPAPPIRRLVAVWASTAVLSAGMLSILSGLSEASWSNRDGYFNQGYAADLFAYAAMPCASAPILLMLLRRGAKWARHRLRST